MIQAIVYSVATGRVRRVVDPQVNVPNVVAFLAQAKAGAGEAVLVYTKQGNGLDNLLSWQAAVTAHTGVTPANDRYCVIDANSKIVSAIIADPACGDGYAGHTLVAHANADPSWTYISGVFTRPPAS